MAALGAAVLVLGCAAPALVHSPTSGAQSVSAATQSRDSGADPALAVASQHACVVRTGTVWCWGSNARDELGDPRVGAATRPVRGPEGTGVIELAAGRTSTCARHDDGTVTCWGAGSPDVQALAGLDTAVELEMVRDRVCARESSGRARCWSLRAHDDLPQELMPSGAVALAGDCAIDEDGREHCFAEPSRSSGTRVPAVKLAGHGFEAEATDIDAARSVARQHVTMPCVLRTDGTVGCWSNDHRLPRMGTAIDRDGLMTVEGIREARQIAVGSEFVCAVQAGGPPTCTTGPIDRKLPIEDAKGLARIDNAVQIVAGQRHACVRRDDGAVTCWGANNVGQLGDGTFEPRPSVAELAEIRVVELAAGDFHTCGRTERDGIWCWGLGEQGQLGDRFTPRVSRDFASRVPGLDDIAEVVTLRGRTCARDRDGRVSCWGLGPRLEQPYEPWCYPGPDGRVVCPPRGGGGTSCGRRLDDRLDAAQPRRVESLTAVDLAVRGSNLLVLSDDGQVLAADRPAACDRRSAVFGDDPRRISSVPDAVELAVGGSLCVRTAAGEVRCSPFIGPSQDGDPFDTVELTSVGVDDATALAVGYRHACALRRDGTVACWGDDPSGQLGNAAAGGDGQPTSVDGLDDVTGLAAGWFHTCARRSNGSVWCWGENDGGSLGDSTTTDRATPTRVVDLEGVSAIDADGWQSCAHQAEGRVSCWGTRPWGSFEPVTGPVQVVLVPRQD